MSALRTALFLFLISISASAVELRIVPDQLYLSTLLSEIDKAKNSVEILQFSFAATDAKGKLLQGSAPYRVFQKIVELRRRNIRVRLYIEGSRDTSARNRMTAELLKPFGVEVVYGATHAKGFLIDENTILMGSTNLTTQSINYNNETNLLVRDLPEISRGFLDYFDLLWNSRARQARIIPETPVEGVQLLTNGQYKPKLLSAIESAKKTIDFSIYYFSDSDIEKALIDAHKRGVMVRGYFNQHKSFALHLVERNRQTVKRLREAGLSKLYFDLPDFFSHSKYLIVDAEQSENQILLLGTGNWNRADVEDHPQLYLMVRNGYLTKKLSRHLSQQIAYESEREKAKRAYHRVWSGWKKGELSYPNFDSAIRDVFIRATVLTGKKGGLHAYLPILTAKNIESTSPLPDEVALVSYEDEETYRALRDTEAGSVYGPLHFEFFDRKSSSLVPKAFVGKAELNTAYDLSEENLHWQSHKVLFVMTPKPKELSTDAYIHVVSDYLKAIADRKGALAIKGYISAVLPEYWLEYVAYSPNTSSEKLRELLTLKKTFQNLEPQHVEVASTEEEDAPYILSRPTAPTMTVVPLRPIPGVVSATFDARINAGFFLNLSEQTFTRNETEQMALMAQIREAFIRNLPVPTRTQ